MSTVDRGLQAVARVRRVRERDSRDGLRRAMDERLARESAVLGLQEQLQGGSRFTDTTPDAFLALRATLAVLEEELATREQAAVTARRLGVVAEEHWHQDRARLEAVELLLQRRAAAARDERARREARELDDIGGQRWLARRREVVR